MSLHFSCFVLLLFSGSFVYWSFVWLRSAKCLQLLQYISAQFGAFTLSEDFKLSSYPTSLFFKYYIFVLAKRYVQKNCLNHVYTPRTFKFMHILYFAYISYINNSLDLQRIFAIERVGMGDGNGGDSIYRLTLTQFYFFHP